MFGTRGSVAGGLRELVSEVGGFLFARPEKNVGRGSAGEGEYLRRLRNCPSGPIGKSE